jgi:hypothetical protein
MSENEGKWPASWPAELEPFRKQARTIEIAAGIQQNIYEICFTNSADFEKAWPAILKLASPGSPGMPGSSVTLYSTNHPPPKDWGDLLRNDKPAVRIYAPSGGYAGSAPGVSGRADVQAAIARGEMLKASPPWPADIVSTNGALPEHVRAKKEDGKLRWVVADLSNRGHEPGFYYRARVDFDVVADGHIIDANKLRLPNGMPLRRIESAPSQSQPAPSRCGTAATADELCGDVVLNGRGELVGIKLARSPRPQR